MGAFPRAHRGRRTHVGDGAATPRSLALNALIFLYGRLRRGASVGSDGGRRPPHLAGLRAMVDWISMWAQVGGHVIVRLTRRGDITAEHVDELYGRIMRETAVIAGEKVDVHCATGGSPRWGAEAARAVQRLSDAEDVPYSAVGEMPVYYTLKNLPEHTNEASSGTNTHVAS